MSKTITIHQYSPSISYGDGISRSLFLVQKLLKELGFNSNIYTSSSKIDDRVTEEVHHISSYIANGSNYLIYHHSIGIENYNLIMKILDKKILIYHNITPSFYFEGKSFIDRCNLGRKQLSESSNDFVGSIADSAYNANELKYWNFTNVQDIPLLVDLTYFKNELKIADIKKESDTYHIIFVGRIIQNKCQHQIIDVAYELRLRNISNVIFYIIGGNHYSDYFNYLIKYRDSLGLTNMVIITDKITDEDLKNHYSNANLYLSLSDHEGFGMPLIESMAYEIPVIAYNVGGISSTIGKYGLIEYKAADKVAKKIINLITNPNLRKKYVRYQNKHLESFQYSSLKIKLIKFLRQIKIELPEK